MECHYPSCFPENGFRYKLLFWMKSCLFETNTLEFFYRLQIHGDLLPEFDIYQNKSYKNCWGPWIESKTNYLEIYVTPVCPILCTVSRVTFPDACHSKVLLSGLNQFTRNATLHQNHLRSLYYPLIRLYNKTGYRGYCGKWAPKICQETNWFEIEAISADFTWLHGLT